MNDFHWIAVAIIAIMFIATLRLAWRQRQPSHLAWPRFTALVVLQWVSAGLLFFALVPPGRPIPGDVLTVLTAHAEQVRSAPADGAIVLALPEARTGTDFARVPDLATALRQHPGTERLTVVGDGLVARDRDVALPPRVQLRAAPPPRGWIDLQVPAVSTPGAVFPVRARAHGTADGRAELLDPAGQLVAAAALDGRGAVALDGVARVVGHAVFQLRLLDGSMHVVDTLPVPVQVAAPVPVRMLMLASAPGPESKYLRRWATDAGLDVQAQAQAGAGVTLGDAPVALTTARLAAVDVLVLDERSLAGLGAAQRAAVQQALREGLGVLVRGSGTLGNSARQTLHDWGLAVSGNAQASALTLGDEAKAELLAARRGPRPSAQDATQWTGEADARSHAAELPAFEQLALRTPGARPLLHDISGGAVGGWQAVGRGRIGLLPVTDTYRAVLAGRDDRHAELWSSVVGTLARPVTAQASIDVEGATPWAGERAVLCGIPAGTGVRGADDATLEPLVVDPATGNARCAAWWPRQAGWHELVSEGAVQAVYMFDPGDARALHRQQQRDATALRVSSAGAPMAAAAQRAPGPRWPWLLAFVLVAGLLWWLERRTTSLDR
ncbi:hypothetical protein [Stenotrophomonas tumulicola]|uniref:Carboxypeptidase regulatory-like domain-containing protein n=1 Tax=Stenotrophomonas tumulicola TaxID=1685415 RepID=A0A7W3FP25_9GAMM|nr:hypothetical protein [Stenotrophomonas tumulicola]MBA8683010.1 hypothetical protein [Stenotrophomonas tumulicola]